MVRSAGFTVQTLSDADLCEFDSRRMLDALRLTYGDTFGRWIEEQFQRTDERLTDFGRRPAAERLVRFFLDLEHRLEARGLVTDGSFEFPLRQEQLADLVGMTVVHTGRLLSDLRNAKQLILERGRVRIQDHDALRRLGGLG